MKNVESLCARFVTRFTLIYQTFDGLVFALLAVIILIPKFQLIPVAGTYVNIRIEDFFVLLVYGLWLIGVIGQRFSINTVFNAKSIILFLLYGFLITLLGVTVLHTVSEPTLGWLHWFRRVEYVGFYFVAATTLKPEKIRTYTYGLLVIGLLTWVYGLLQLQNLVPGVHTLSQSGRVGTYSEIGYLISTFAAHYDFGGFLILMVLLSIWGYFSHTSLWQKSCFVVMAFAFWWMSRVVYGRAAYLGMLVAAVSVLTVKLSPWVIVPLYEIYQTFSRYLGGRFSRYAYELNINWNAAKPTPTPIDTIPTPSPTRMPLLSPTPDPSIPIGPIPQPTWLDNLIDSLSVHFHAAVGTFDIHLDPSANIRMQEWQDAFAKVKYNYVWGGGYYTAGLGTDNDYLRHLVEVGVIGLAWFLLILFDFTRKAWQLFRSPISVSEKNYYLVVAGFIIGLLVEAVFIDIFESSKIAFLFWFLMATISIQFSNAKIKE